VDDEGATDEQPEERIEIAPLHPAGSEGSASYPPPGVAHLDEDRLAALAPYGARVGGYVIDYLIVGLLVRAVTSQLGLSIAAQAAITIVVRAIYASLLIAYLDGRTLGMRFLNLRCVGLDRRRHVGLGQSLLRAFSAELIAAGSLLGVVGLLGPVLDLLWPTWDADRQTLHDKIARTVVIR